MCDLVRPRVASVNAHRPTAQLRSEIVHPTLVLPLLLAASSLDEAADAEEIRVRDILTVKEIQEQDRGPALIEYQVSETWSVQLLRAIQQRRRGPVPQGGVTTTAKVRLAYSGPAVSVTRDGTVLSNGAVHPIATPYRYVYDGKTTKILEDGQYKVSDTPTAAVTVPLPWDVTGDRELMLALRGWRDGKYAQQRVKVNISMKDVAGPDKAPRVVVEILGSTGRKLTARLIPGLKYAVETVEVFDTNKQTLVSRSDRCVYKEVKGKIIPISAVHTGFTLGDGGKPVVAREQKLTVSKVDVGAEAVPPDAFTLDMPKDAEVYNIDTQQRVEDPAAVKDYLASLGDFLPGAHQSYPRVGVFVALGAVVGAIGAASVVVRNRLRRRGPAPSQGHPARGGGSGE